MQALTVLLGDAALSAYAALYAKVQHKLFADVAAGRSAVSKKSEYIEEHGIPARMFNAARITLDGKVSAVRGSQLLQLDSLRRRVSRAEKQVDKAEQECQWRQVHGKRRRLANLRFRRSGLEADIAAGRVRLCFGSKKLWRKQYDLKANGSVMMHGLKSGVLPAATSSSCWAAGMRRLVASCAWRPSMTTVR